MSFGYSVTFTLLPNQCAPHSLLIVFPSNCHTMNNSKTSNNTTETGYRVSNCLRIQWRNRICRFSMEFKAQIIVGGMDVLSLVHETQISSHNALIRETNHRKTTTNLRGNFRREILGTEVKNGQQNERLRSTVGLIRNSSFGLLFHDPFANTFVAL